MGLIDTVDVAIVLLLSLLVVAVLLVGLEDYLDDVGVEFVDDFLAEVVPV